MANTIPTESKYTLRLDEYTLEQITTILELEEQAKHLDPDSNAWLNIEYEIEEKMKELGWSIIYEFKELPF